MRTTEGLTSTCVPQSPSFKARMKNAFAVLFSVVRAFRNRTEINQLHDLDDNQLRDIGLTRGDLESALTTSAFFEDPSAHLTRSARRRAYTAWAMSGRG